MAETEGTYTLRSHIDGATMGVPLTRPPPPSGRRRPGRRLCPSSLTGVPWRLDWHATSIEPDEALLRAVARRGPDRPDRSAGRCSNPPPQTGCTPVPTGDRVRALGGEPLRRPSRRRLGGRLLTARGRVVAPAAGLLRWEPRARRSSPREADATEQDQQRLDGDQEHGQRAQGVRAESGAPEQRLGRPEPEIAAVIPARTRCPVPAITAVMSSRMAIAAAIGRRPRAQRLTM